MHKGKILTILGLFVLGFGLWQVEAHASMYSFEVYASDWLYPNPIDAEETSNISSLPISAYVPNAAGAVIGSNFGSATASSGYAWAQVNIEVDTASDVELSFDYSMFYFGSGYAMVQVQVWKDEELGPSFIVSSDKVGNIGTTDWSNMFALDEGDWIGLSVYVDAMNPMSDPTTPGFASATISNVQVDAVPLPPSVLLLGLGLFGLLGIRRRCFMRT